VAFLYRIPVAQRLSRLLRKRSVWLLITHKLSTDHGSQFDVVQTRPWAITGRMDRAS
jgi:hypothetical protein